MSTAAEEPDTCFEEVSEATARSVLGRQLQEGYALKNLGMEPGTHLPPMWLESNDKYTTIKWPDRSPTTADGAKIQPFQKTVAKPFDCPEEAVTQELMGALQEKIEFTVKCFEKRSLGKPLDLTTTQMDESEAIASVCGTLQSLCPSVVSPQVWEKLKKLEEQVKPWPL
jgi:hypothetical protein